MGIGGWHWIFKNLSAWVFWGKLLFNCSFLILINFLLSIIILIVNDKFQSFLLLFESYLFKNRKNIITGIRGCDLEFCTIFVQYRKAGKWRDALNVLTANNVTRKLGSTWRTILEGYDTLATDPTSRGVLRPRLVSRALNITGYPREQL